jgi:hypothetical protein
MIMKNKCGVALVTAAPLYAYTPASLWHMARIRCYRV